MNYLQSETVEACRQQLTAEYAEALAMVNSGCVIPLNDLLRRSLSQVADEIQNAIDDEAELTSTDLALLCAAEAKTHIELNTENYKHFYYRRNSYTRTLFEYSRSVLSVIE